MPYVYVYDIPECVCVVSKCKMFTCGYMNCVYNKCNIEAQKYTTMFVSSQPSSIHTKAIHPFVVLYKMQCSELQQCNGSLGIKHYPCISLTCYTFLHWVLYATNSTLPECLLLSRLFTHC